MYIPKAFEETNDHNVQRLIRENGFATLITSTPDGPFASHLPFLFDSRRGELGTIRSHMAKANPHWHHFANGGEVLVIFQGPHAYISPTWYKSGPAVPTWNYAVVHAYGKAILTDEIELKSILEDTVAQYESAAVIPWTIESQSDGFMNKLIKAIVGFEIEITRLECKVKMNQNRTVEDQFGVIDALKQSANSVDVGVADIMQQIIDTSAI